MLWIELKWKGSLSVHLSFDYLNNHSSDQLHTSHEEAQCRVWSCLDVRFSRKQQAAIPGQAIGPFRTVLNGLNTRRGNFVVCIRCNIASLKRPVWAKSVRALKRAGQDTGGQRISAERWDPDCANTRWEAWPLNGTDQTLGKVLPSPHKIT